MVVSLVGALQIATLGAFVYDMLPVVPDKMPEACLLVLCLMAALLLHYRQASCGKASMLMAHVCGDVPGTCIIVGANVML